MCFEGQSMGAGEVAEDLIFHETRRLQCKGRLAVQWIASAPVTLTRKAKPRREAPDGKRMAPIPGAPLALRLGGAVSAIRGDECSPVVFTRYAARYGGRCPECAGV